MGYSLKEKKSITINNAFQKGFKKSNCKPSNIWVDKGSEFCDRSVKSWLEKNYVEMHSVNNEGKSVVAKKFIRTLTHNLLIHDCNIKKCLYS